MKWFAAFGLVLWAVILVCRWSTPLDPEDDPTCPDEVDDCESWPTWFEEAS